MEHREDDFELSEEELMNVHSRPEVIIDRPDEFEKAFGNRGKKELEAMKEILEAGRPHKDSFNSGRRGR